MNQQLSWIQAISFFAEALFAIERLLIDLDPTDLAKHSRKKIVLGSEGNVALL